MWHRWGGTKSPREKQILHSSCFIAANDLLTPVGVFSWDRLLLRRALRYSVGSNSALQGTPLVGKQPVILKLLLNKAFPEGYYSQLPDRRDLTGESLKIRVPRWSCQKKWKANKGKKRESQQHTKLGCGTQGENVTEPQHGPSWQVTWAYMRLWALQHVQIVWEKLRLSSLVWFSLHY